MRELVVEEDGGLAQDVVPLEGRQPEDGGVEVHLEVGADLVAAGQGGGEAGCRQVILQDARRAHGTCRQDHHGRLVDGAIGATDTGDRRRFSRRVQQPDDGLLGEQREAGIVADQVDQVALGIGFVAAGRREAVEVLGLDRVLEDLLLQSQRQGLGPPGRIVRDDPVDQRLQLGLVVEAVDVQQRLGLVVVGRQLVVAERPGEGLMGRVGRELVGGEAEQCGAIPLGLAAEIVELAGGEFLVLAVDPRLLVLEAAGLEHLS